MWRKKKKREYDNAYAYWNDNPCRDRDLAYVNIYCVNVTEYHIMRFRLFCYILFECVDLPSRFKSSVFFCSYFSLTSFLSILVCQVIWLWKWGFRYKAIKYDVEKRRDTKQKIQTNRPTRTRSSKLNGMEWNGIDWMLAIRGNNAHKIYRKK